MKFATASSLIFSCALALAAGSAARAADPEVVISSTGGAFAKALQENFYEPFTAATKIKVVRVDTELPAQFARLQAELKTGSSAFDIITAGPADLIEKRDLLQPIDCAKLPNLAKEGIEGACTGWGIIRTLGGMVVTFNKEAFPKEKPSKWADFWDVKTFPGPRGLPDTGDREWWVPTMALLADGVPADKLFPLDLDRAYKKLDQLKPHVAVWYKSNDQAQQALRKGDVVLAMVVSGRAVGVMKEGHPIDLNWNQSIRDVGLWAVAKGTRHPEAAMKFLDFFLGGAKAHLAFANVVNYDTGNRSSLELVPEAERSRRIAYPENLKSQIVPDYKWVAENRDKLRERWNEWLLK
ncbi:MAG: polyamine ABC transporter substrate-binding protein [Bosea sp.]|uniref:ABC transporter substrate-binding protein n=1 Tax=Bosea sp. (in: a-proteobacteria) TaxID=1871050 RepID=UPI001AD5D3F7|nr:extracellular solute-binding protein [Bosea sp. (in: a-proteobacteria)]MBN9451497.1 polyamine ABC transporter substrate-binding protein [Bosea sp. (in: a-proteobacteria)]